MTGVYAILHRPSGRRYIGSAQRSFLQRWKEHQRALRRGVHSSPRLQADFNHDGPGAFAFEVVIYSEPFECVRYEQFFIDFWHHRGSLYNDNPLASWEFSDRGGRGYLPPGEARRRLDEIRAFNRLFRALRSEGIPFEEAERIPRNLYPPEAVD